ncbi:MAG: methyltransferase, TIGR04325 family [Niabella sp.]
MRTILKQFAPPIAKALKYYSFKYGWKGDYPSYEIAKAQTRGYDENHILNRIVETTRLVKNGEAAYERDGIIYDEVQVNINLLSALLLVASRNDNKLTVIDFGGSLGTSYYQNIAYLSHLETLNWCIVEQSHFVDIGKKEFEDDHLKFFHTVEECLQQFPEANLLLFSSSLQYLEKPYETLKDLQRFEIPYLMLDLIAFNSEKRDRITIQYVPPVFYGIEASYPCTFFNKEKLNNQLKENYTLEFDFEVSSELYYIQLKPFRYEGALWRHV